MRPSHVGNATHKKTRPEPTPGWQQMSQKRHGPNQRQAGSKCHTNVTTSYALLHVFVSGMKGVVIGITVVAPCWMPAARQLGLALTPAAN